MRLFSAFALLIFATPLLAAPASAAPIGLATDHFERTWTSLPSGSFTPVAPPLPVDTVAVHAAIVPAGILAGALASAADEGARRDLALDEMATAWQPAQRTALEELRTTRRAYAATASADAGVGKPRFAALVRQVVDGSGRSVAHDDGASADTLATDAYHRAMDTMPAADLPGLQASERAWNAYRGAFGQFARAMDRPDAARGVDDELSRDRAAELINEISK